MIPGIDIIILAGGKATRMAGRNKATIAVDGERLIDQLLDEIAMNRETQQVVVVTPTKLELRPGVKQTSEEPAHGGPVAGIAAGLALIEAVESTEYTAILPVDAPRAAALVPVILAEIRDTPTAEVLYAGEQQLCAVWRSQALRARLAALPNLREATVEDLVGPATSVSVDGNGDEEDYNTLEELEELGEVSEG